MLRSNRPLRRLLAAWLQSCLGTGAGYVALLLLTTDYLHTSWALAGVLLADFLPAIALGSWFGALADRYPRRNSIVLANVVQAGAWGGLALVHTAVPIYTLALVAGVGNGLQRPALRSGLPIVAGSASQVAAAVYDTCRWLGITLGPLVAAGLFALSGVAVVLALNGLSFLVAAAVMLTVAIDSPPRPQTHEEKAASGLRRFWQSPSRHRGSLPSSHARSGRSSPAGSERVRAAAREGCPARERQRLRAARRLLRRRDGHRVGACCAPGAVASRILVRRYLDAQILTAAGMFGSAIVGSVAAATVAFAATGYGNALLLVSAAQLVQLRVPSAVQGRLFGAKDTIEGAALMVGLVGAGAMIAGVGVRLTLAAGAGICAVCALLAIITVRMDAPARAAAAVRRSEPGHP